MAFMASKIAAISIWAQLISGHLTRLLYAEEVAKFQALLSGVQTSSWNSLLERCSGIEWELLLRGRAY